MRVIAGIFALFLVASNVHSQPNLQSIDRRELPLRFDGELPLGLAADEEIEAGETARFLFRASGEAREFVVTVSSPAGNVRLIVRDAASGEALCQNDSADASKSCGVALADGGAFDIAVTGDTYARYSVRVAPAAVAPPQVHWTVPYVSQQWYANIGESACGPTSVTMLLRYYYPNSGIDMTSVYHNGTQLYSYNGPAVGYRNVGFAKGDSGLSIVPWQYWSYYTGSDSSAVSASIQSYLDHHWGIAVTPLGNAEATIISSVKKQPLLARVWGNGVYGYAHYLVITGIDADGSIIVNDPYTWKDPKTRMSVNGNGRRVARNTFFSSWLREAFLLTPPDSLTSRMYSVVVDTSNTSLECSCTPAGHRLAVEEPYDIWRAYYGWGSNYYYPTVGGKAARWTPKLPRSGRYRIALKISATSGSGAVSYAVYDSTGKYLTGVTVDHRGSGWKYVILGDYYLTAGASVKAWNIPANTRIAAVKFIFLQ